jgi:hypothetical protein
VWTGLVAVPSLALYLSHHLLDKDNSLSCFRHERFFIGGFDMRIVRRDVGLEQPGAVKMTHWAGTAGEVYISLL